MNKEKADLSVKVDAIELEVKSIQEKLKASEEKNAVNYQINHIFIILVVSRLSVKQMAGPISAADRLRGNTALKKHRSSGNRLATLSDLAGPRIKPQTSLTDGDIFYN